MSYIDFDLEATKIKQEQESFIVEVKRVISARTTKYHVTTCDTSDFELGEVPTDISNTSIYNTPKEAFAKAFQKILDSNSYHEGINIKVINKL
jgi:uncharacterized protein YejL (UPF0352 family)